MTLQAGPDPLQAMVITYPAPYDHTHTWQHRWEEIRRDLLQEHLGLLRTHRTLRPVRGIDRAPHGVHTPGLWVQATPINAQAGDDIKATLCFQQTQTQTPHRNTQRGLVGIQRPRHSHPPAESPPPRIQHHLRLSCRASGSHQGGGPGDLEPTIPGRNKSSVARERPRETPRAKTTPARTQTGHGRKSAQDE